MNSLPFYYHEQVWVPFSANVLGWQFDFHQLMLEDRIRMQKYRQAIFSAIRPGMTVLDLGTGTGILAKWALEAGAARVYGIEVNPATLDKAVEELSRAGFAERFIPLLGLSYDITLPEPVDIIISEIIGNLADNEDCVAILADARQRFLRPGGAMLPDRLQSQFVPVAAMQAHRQVAAGKVNALSEHYDLSELLSHLQLHSRFDLYYDTVLPRSTYLAAPQTGASFDLCEVTTAGNYTSTLRFVARSDGLLTGFKGSFAAWLTDSVVLDISGDDIAAGTVSDSWKHAFLPIAEPVPVLQGDTILFDFSRFDGDASCLSCRYAWSGQVVRGDRIVAEFSQTMKEAAPAVQ